MEVPVGPQVATGCQPGTASAQLCLRHSQCTTRCSLQAESDRVFELSAAAAWHESPASC